MESIFNLGCIKCEILHGKHSPTAIDDNGREECLVCSYTRPFSSVKFAEEIAEFKAEAAKAASE